MDPISISEYQSAQLSSEVSTRVARKVLDQQEQAGDAAVQQLQQALELQKHLDKGLDVYA